jgi:hypothetical protein
MQKEYIDKLAWIYIKDLKVSNLPVRGKLIKEFDC